MKIGKINQKYSKMESLFHFCNREDYLKDYLEADIEMINFIKSENRKLNIVKSWEDYCRVRLEINNFNIPGQRLFYIECSEILEKRKWGWLFDEI